MAIRDRYVDIVGDYVVIGADKLFRVLDDISVTVWKLDAAGARAASPATIYSSRAGGALGNPFLTVNGQVDFFADSGEYEIDMTDTVAVARIAARTVNWSAVNGAPGGIDKTQLPESGQSLWLPGDIKWTAWRPATATPWSDPAGWAWADGRVVQRAVDPWVALFAAIGTDFNQGGETASEYRLPDYRGSHIIGADNFGSAAGAAGRLAHITAGLRTLGKRLGAHTVQLTSQESGVASHGHGVNDPGHGHNIKTGSNPGGTWPPNDGHDYIVETNSLRLGQGINAANNGTDITIVGAAPAGAANAHNNTPLSQVANALIKL